MQAYKTNFESNCQHAIFYKSIFKTACSFFFNITLKTNPSSVSTQNEITIIY